MLKSLKKGKSRDPNDMSNELFQGAENDFSHALLVIMNQIKEQLIYPQALQTCNITSIYKKGKRNLFDNYRCIFRLTLLRRILDRLIYNDVYPIIDMNLTDANVGARKARNIRDNLFVLNAISNSVTRGSEEPCEVGIYDLRDVLTHYGCKTVLMISTMLDALMTNSYSYTKVLKMQMLL